MRRIPLRLHYRILIPFALVALLATAATAYVTFEVAVRAVESRVQAQIRNAAMLVTNGGFATNVTILRSVKAIAGADVLAFDAQGVTLASTFERVDDPLARAVIDGARRPSPLPADSDDAVVRQVPCDGRCDVVYRRVPSNPGLILAVVANPSEIRAATTTVARAILIAALLSLTAMIVVSQFVARRISAPLDTLVRFAHDVSMSSTDAASDHRAPVGDDEIGRLGAAFNDMIERLDQSQRALLRSEKLGLAGLMAARVAHDIRNPLSSIKMRTQLVEAQIADAKARASLATVRHDIATVEAVIRDLLEVARPSDVQLKPASLNDVVRDLLAHLADQFTHRKISVHAEFADALPQVMIDAERFKGALLNVILNAADAMPTGGTLFVRTSDDRANAIVTIGDDGVGIDPAVIDRVFEPFVTTKREGVGLGLVNTKAVVESHGGSVNLAPRAPRGTLATIRIPVLKV